MKRKNCAPIISNFKEGLNELEYFISTHGARKGLADTALKTSNSGYLTRKLVDVAQDCIVVEDNCKTNGYITASVKIESGKVISPLRDMALGRVSSETVLFNSNSIVNKNQLIDENVMSRLEKHHVETIKVRSVLMCQNKFGICSYCYGRDLSTGRMVNLGEAVGVIAAQSIGEPGTQLTMRTFHVGGAAQKIVTKSDILASHSGTLKFYNSYIIKDKSGYHINMSKNCEAYIFEDGIEKFR